MRYTGSLIGSTQGKVTLSADHNVHITGSDVLSKTGTTLVGDNVTIDVAVGHADSHHEYSLHRAGVSGGFGGEIGHLADRAYARKGSRTKGVTHERGHARKGSGLVFHERGQVLSFASTLQAARDITLTASHDTREQSNHHHSSSGSIGVGFGLGSEQNGFTIELAAAAARGKAGGHGTTYTATHVNAGDTLTLTSGRDTTLDGAQASGETILADIGRNLTLTSTQDTNECKEKDQSASAGLSLCIPPLCYGTSSGSASYQKRGQVSLPDNRRQVNLNPLRPT